jgi:hypothetical protein
MRSRKDYQMVGHYTRSIYFANRAFITSRKDLQPGGFAI